MASSFPSDWVLAPLEKCIEKLIDYRGKSPQKSSSGIPLITAKVVKSGRIDTRDMEYIRPDEYNAWMRRGLPKRGDVVLTSEAPLGEVAQIMDDRVALAQRLFTLRGATDRLNNTFLKFFLQADFAQNQLRALATGTTVLGVKQSELRRLIIALPPLPEQRAIAHVLGALDDKIELNRKTSETLEAMARALFKSWFVDFDPVRAKSEGRTPAGMDAETAKLFPDGFEQSTLGPVPRGWIVGPALSLFTLMSGGTPKTNVREYWGGNIKWASAKDVSQASGFFLLDTERKITEAGVNSSAAKVLPRNSVVVVARGATCGRHVVLGEEMAMNQTCYALVPRQTEAQWYICFLADGLIERLVRQAHGSVFDTITTATFETARALNPSEKAVDAFSRLVSPWLQRLHALQRECGVLSELRDTLLPKLMSGEIRIQDAEKLASDAL